MPLSALKALAAAELAAALAPFQESLGAIASGDGSVASVVGQGVALQGNLVAVLPTLEKVGIHNIASDLNKLLTDFIAKQTETLTAGTEKAADAPTEKAAAETAGESAA